MKAISTVYVTVEIVFIDTFSAGFVTYTNTVMEKLLCKECILRWARNQICPDY